MPLVLAVYWILPPARRNAVLACASLVFYAWGAGAFVLLLLACIAVNFTAGLIIDRPGMSPGVRRLALVGTAGFDLGVLAIWKMARSRPGSSIS